MIASLLQYSINMPKNESHFFMAMDVEDTKTPWPDVKEK